MIDVAENIEPITVKALNPFKVLYHLPPDINLVILIGGRGGAKTYEASKFIAFSATIRKKRCAVLRDEKSTIRDSIFNEILLRYDKANEYGTLDLYYEKNDNEIKDKTTGTSVVFTKGFRASSKEKTATMKGVSDVDIAVIEEAEDIRDKKKYDTFADSIRKEGYLIIIILNTPDIEHWIVQRYFDTVAPDIDTGNPKDVDGYFKLVPKNIPGFICIQTNYKDNVNPKTGISNLPTSKVTEYEGYGTPGHHLFDWHHYMTDILGYASTGRKGQVLTKCKPITLEEYLAVPVKEVIGQDFGTSSPAATCGVKIDGNNVYAREINYLPKDNLEIGKMYCRMKLTDSDVIIADSAEPTSVGRLRNGWQRSELSPADIETYPDLLKGWNVFGMIKGPGSIEGGISTLKAYNLFIYGDNFWIEIRNYIYAVDKWGSYTNTPIDAFNHLIDMLRGVVASKGRYF